MKTANRKQSETSTPQADPTGLAAPRALGDYAIVHELAHLLVPSHSKLFKSHLHAYLPNWKAQESRLGKIGQTPKQKGD